MKRQSVWQQAQRRSWSSCSTSIWVDLTAGMVCLMKYEYRHLSAVYLYLAPSPCLQQLCAATAEPLRVVLTQGCSAHGHSAAFAVRSSIDRSPLGGTQADMLSCTSSAVHLQVRKVLFQPSKLSKYMGMDVTSLMSVPLFIMEPFSMLQKMAEIMEYTHLLDMADAEEDPYER